MTMKAGTKKTKRAASKSLARKRIQPASRNRSAAQPASARGPKTLPVEAKEGQTREQLISIVSAQGVLASAGTVQAYSMGVVGEGDILQLVGELQGTIKASKAGDCGIADNYLVPQVVALNAIFNECMRRAALNMGEYPDAMERYMRLAFKAQNQSRATLESLARIKNPPNVAFVRQANIANGPQQVNNGGAPPGDTSARAQENENTPIELLENSHDEWVDTRATGTAGRSYPKMAAMGQVHGAKD